jgi:hypothetical protein
MITPRDEDYLQTKLIKRTGASLESPFKELAAWIAAQYGVHVLNVVYDTVIPDNRPRLSVVLESRREVGMFRNAELGNYNVTEQKRVKERFEAIVLEQHLALKVDGLFVVFVAFEPIARIEANERVTKEEIHRLKARLANDELWEISTCFDSVTFFFYTDIQVKRAQALGMREQYAQEYASLVQRYDEFGYFKKCGVLVAFDSKENFDNNYQSNWYYYYK